MFPGTMAVSLAEVQAPCGVPASKTLPLHNVFVTQRTDDVSPLSLLRGPFASHISRLRRFYRLSFLTVETIRNSPVFN